ncbi:MAG: nicotinate (nicotinamide) nucleotide adenylyltransferase [Lachnospiraceae bacterium]|nr:nicotinate (nicotinamide) nucleotide adenylyltransferase [Lachnospiraceae bacterium]
MGDTKRHIGIMGGTFDPVHNAHLVLAEQAYEQYALDEIWMLPNGNPPHKRDTRQADVECRMEMLRLAIRDVPYLKLCDLERSSSSYHYTYETLQRLNRRYPDTVFYFIMGADSLFEFDRWKEPGMISRECILLAAVRDHHARGQIQDRIRELNERYGAKIHILDTPNMDIASADIRERLAEGTAVSHLLPAAVEMYIRQKGLYGSGTDRTAALCQSMEEKKRNLNEVG